MNTNTYQTTNLALAAFVITQGFRLHDVIGNTSKKTFVFPHTAELRQKIGEFESLSASTEPMAYFSALRFLKSIIHNHEYK